jgi:hypothetical protein
MKRIFRISSTSFLFLSVFFALIKAQTQSILILKDGLAIKCDLVRIIPDSVIVVQIADSVQVEYPYNQVSSLISSLNSSSLIPLPLKNDKPKISRTNGIYIGKLLSPGEQNGIFNGGWFLGAQIGTGLNPGFLAQVVFGSYNKYSSLNSNILLSVLIGPRYCLYQSKPGTGIFISTMMGFQTAGKFQLALGISVDVYIIPKLFLGTRLSTSADLSDQTKSYVAFIFGYGIN